MDDSSQTISRELASSMMNATLEANRQLLNVLRDVELYGNEDLTKRVKDQIAEVLGNSLIFVMNPIGSLHPDLYPEALGTAPQAVTLFNNS